jgi:hypothetical protein
VALLAKIRRENGGQALVEFALVLPLLLLLLMAVFEFGNVFHSYLTITNAAREGARLGVVNPDADIENCVRTVCSALDTSKLEITVAPQDPVYRKPGYYLTVDVRYKVFLITPLLSNFLPNPMDISARSVMRIE